MSVLGCHCSLIGCCFLPLCFTASAPVQPATEGGVSSAWHSGGGVPSQPYSGQLAPPPSAERAAAVQHVRLAQRTALPAIVETGVCADDPATIADATAVPPRLLAASPVADAVGACPSSHASAVSESVAGISYDAMFSLQNPEYVTYRQSWQEKQKEYSAPATPRSLRVESTGGSIDPLELGRDAEQGRGMPLDDRQDRADGVAGQSCGTALALLRASSRPPSGQWTPSVACSARSPVLHPSIPLPPLVLLRQGAVLPAAE